MMFGMQSGMDTRDAAVNSLLQEVTTLLSLLVEQGGEALVQHLASTVLPQNPLPQELKVGSESCPFWDKELSHSHNKREFRLMSTCSL